ncbi:unnamed protein product [Protopolystoma xenopodis]|uniref:Uncharacterized protein n=1 Tax=Protopolystoma xenopodis TaxID=117903 RepID=A0A3S5BML7_9PLAT|nr:unnamed protein product [Protopolystoma xenopodis]
MITYLHQLRMVCTRINGDAASHFVSSVATAARQFEVSEVPPSQPTLGSHHTSSPYLSSDPQYEEENRANSEVEVPSPSKHADGFESKNFIPASVAIHFGKTKILCTKQMVAKARTLLEQTRAQARNDFSPSTLQTSGTGGRSPVHLIQESDKNAFMHPQRRASTGNLPNYI